MLKYKLIPVDEDIDGSAYNVCPYCGGEKEFIDGENAYGDNTHQRIRCKKCGFRGEREIIYKGDFRKSYFYSSILLDFIECKGSEKLKIKKLTFIKCKNGYSAYYKHLPIKRFKYALINWDEKKIKLIFNVYKKPISIKKYLFLLMPVFLVLVWIAEDLGLNPIIAVILAFILYKIFRDYFTKEKEFDYIFETDFETADKIFRFLDLYEDENNTLINLK